MARIFVVEDERSIAKTFQSWLTEAGYEVVVFNSGMETLRQLVLETPDLILLDLVLPDFSGLQICRSIKENDQFQRIPIIFITSSTAFEHRIRCLEAGADEFLTKPTDRVELLTRVRSLIRSKQLSDRLLLSYYEMDQLGRFAESFLDSSLTEWRRDELAYQLGIQILGERPDMPHQPRFLWGGRMVQDRLLGITFYYRDETLQQVDTQFPLPTLLQELKPFQRGENQYVSREPFPLSLYRLLNVPEELSISNIVATHSPDQNYWVLIGGFPWEVGTYEFPLLRALIRHWSVFERIRKETRRTEKAFFYTLESLGIVAEYFDEQTANHIRRVAAFCSLIAQELGCPPRFVHLIGQCSEVHDIGKIAVPLRILRKSRPLNNKERRIIMTHTEHGARLLGDAEPLKMAKNIALYHHENYDGTGYPKNLREEEIPLEARILKIIDVYDALRSVRPYKPAFTHEKAVEIIQHGDDRVQPAHFDPQVFTAFLDLHQRMNELYTQISESYPFKAPTESYKS